MRQCLTQPSRMEREPGDPGAPCPVWWGGTLVPVACCSGPCESQRTSNLPAGKALWGPRGGGVRSLRLARALPPECQVCPSAWRLRSGLPFPHYTPSLRNWPPSAHKGTSCHRPRDISELSWGTAGRCLDPWKSRAWQGPSCNHYPRDHPGSVLNHLMSIHVPLK